MISLDQSIQDARFSFWHHCDEFFRLWFLCFFGDRVVVVVVAGGGDVGDDQPASGLKSSHPDEPDLRLILEHPLDARSFILVLEKDSRVLKSDDVIAVVWLLLALDVSGLGFKSWFN